MFQCITETAAKKTLDTQKNGGKYMKHKAMRTTAAVYSVYSMNSTKKFDSSTLTFHAFKHFSSSQVTNNGEWQVHKVHSYTGLILSICHI